MIVMARGFQFKVTAEPNVQLDKALSSGQFNEWLERMDNQNFKVKSVHFQSLDMFGSLKVGFVKFNAEVHDRDGNWVPGITFGSGAAVVMLVILICKGKRHALLTSQPRVPTGCFDFLEAPAGSMDGSTDYLGAAVRETGEELHLSVSAEDFVDLNAFAGHNDGTYTSPGRTTETLRFFCVEKEVTPEELAGFDGRPTGLASEGERITVKVVPLSNLWRVPDAKTVVAYTLYKQLLASRAAQKRSLRRRQKAA